MEKLCRICENMYTLDNFRKNSKSKDGHGIYCKPCLKQKYKERVSDPEYKKKLAKQRADNHIENKEKINKRHAENYQKNKSIINQKRVAYYRNNPKVRLAENCRVRIRELLKNKTQLKQANKTGANLIPAKE